MKFRRSMKRFMVIAMTISLLFQQTGVLTWAESISAEQSQAEVVVEPEPTAAAEPVAQATPEPVVQTAPEPVAVAEVAPVVEETPVPEPAPVVEETPVPEPAPVVEETPVPEQTPVVEETPVPEQTPAVEETPVPEQTPAVEETPVPEQTPAVEEMPAPEQTPEAEETPAPEETPVPEETPAPEEITPVVVGEISLTAGDEYTLEGTAGESHIWATDADSVAAITEYDNAVAKILAVGEGTAVITHTYVTEGTEASELYNITVAAAEKKTAELDTTVKQEVIQNGDEHLVKYTLVINNLTADAEATEVTVKTVLGEKASYKYMAAETTGLKYVENIGNVPAGLDLNELAVYSAEELSKYESAVIWNAQTIAGGARAEYTFYASVDEDVKSAEEVKAMFFVAGKRVANEKIQWINSGLIKPAYAEAGTYTAEAANASVSVNVPENVKLPYGTTLTAEKLDEVSVEIPVPSDMVLAASESYKLGFAANGEAVQPEGGAVDVAFTFVEAILSAKADTKEPAKDVIKVYSLVDGVLTEVEAAIAQDEATAVTGMSFSTESLSTYVIARFTEKPDTKRTYTYSDGNVTVIATLQYATAVPDEAEFRVTPVTASTSGYNYDAYMQALNNNADAIAAASEVAGASADAEYTEKNTLLYDIAFMVDKTDENGNVIEGEKVEYQPEEGSVTFSFTFKAKQLENEIEAEKKEEVTVVHLPLEESVKVSVDSTADATNISAGNVEVEIVDATVSLNASTDKAKFSLDGLSLVAFVGVTGQELNPGTTRTYRDILGDAVYYGIVSNIINKTGHMDTNFATNELTGTGNVTAGAYTGNKNGGIFIIADKTDTQEFSIDGSAVNVWCTEEDASLIKISDTSTKLITSKSALQAYVNSMLAHVTSVSRAMAAETSYVVEKVSDQNNADIDITSRPDGTYYIALKELLDGAQTGAIKIKKKSTQTIVFNYTGTDSIALERFSVWNIDVENDYQSSATSNGAIDVTARTIVFNMPNVTSFSNDGGICGIVIAPNAYFNISSTSSGWLITNSMKSDGGEWHNVWSEMPSQSEIPVPIELSAVKCVDGSTPGANEKFSFLLEEGTKDSEGEWTWTTKETVQNNGSIVAFSKITYSESGTYYYRMSEVSVADDETYTYDAHKYIVVVTVAQTDSLANNVTTYYVDSVKYYKTDDADAISESNSVVNAEFHNTTKETKEISVTKKWSDQDNNDGKRPESVQVQLYANNVAVEGKVVTLSEDNDWTATWKELPNATSDGETIDYTVKEVNVPEGYYIESISGTMGTGFTITNKHANEKISVSGTKVWSDENDRDGIRPTTITVNLFADNTFVKSTTVSADKDGNWTYSFDYLDKYKDGKEITYTVTEDAVDGYKTTINGYTIKNTHDSEKRDVSVEKVWIDDDDQDGLRPDSIFVQLLADGEAYGAKVELNEQNLWKWTWNNLPVNREGKQGEAIVYTIEEVKVPDGYKSVVTGGVTNGFKITNSHNVELTEVSVKKEWDDKDNQDGIRPSSITVQLYADETAYGKEITLNEANNWSYTWEGLAKNDDGDEIVYTVKESGVPSGYKTETTGDAATGFIIKNTHEPAKTSIEVTKVWLDSNNADGIRPAKIRVQLYANGEASGDPVELTGPVDEPWSYKWTDLDKYANGKEITYTVKEMDVPGAYTVTTSGDMTTGYVITNSYKREVTEISVKKDWQDDNNRDGLRTSSITVKLSANGSEIGTAELSEANNWSFKWSALPKNYGGQPIAYTVEEVDVPTGYSADVTGSAEDGFIIENKHVPAETEVSVSKVWNDKDNQDGIRPASITVQLLANGKASGEAVTLNEANKWEYTWTKLPVNDAGKAIDYTIEEVNVPTGYISVITGNASAGYVVTNTHDVEVMDVPVEKVWYDKDNQDGIRPASINVQLYANGSKYGEEVTLNTTNHWTYVWNKLPKYANGTEITYTVKEINVPEKYTSVVTGGTKNGFTITNSYDVELTEISVNKVWDDSDNQDGIRPSSVEVQLYADGTAVGTPVVLYEKNNWSYKWEELAENANGKEIVYTVEEVNVPDGYTSVVTGDANKGFVVTNSYDALETDISVSKVWVDKDDTHGIRPDSIQVQLYADGTEVGEAITLSESNSWSYEWTGLPVNKAGSAINYTVKEIGVPEGYTSVVSGGTVNGFVITNTCEHLEMIEIPVSKVWDDNNNQDGLRPSSIKVQLYADGEAVDGPVVLNASNNWSYRWEKLEKNEKGQLIVYTVKEVDVPDGYKYVVTGDNINGYVLTNTHKPAETEVSVNKVWNDSDNQDGIRPTEIKVQLLADGKASGTAVTLNAANNWTYTWTGLAAKNAGKDIDYTVKEVEVPAGYTSAITGTEANGYVITNTHEAEVISIPVQKVWFDNNDAHNDRPSSVKVQLYADGKAAGDAVVLDESNSWSSIWKDLAKYADGKLITYTVEEVEVPEGYISAVTGGTENGFTVTNSCHHVEMTEITVTKVWDDNNNQDGIRPADVSVQLYADGEALGEPAILNAVNNWTYTWEELAVNDDHENIVYTVEEVGVVNGYTSVITGTQADGYVITNSHKAETINIPVTKVWYDKDDIHGTRPESVEVQLYANGEPAGEAVTLTAEAKWYYEWTDLAKYADGKLISYTLEEINVPENYTSVVTGGTENGFTVTNSCEHIEMIEVPVTKVWNDNNDKAGKRTDSIEVQLYADGAPYGSTVILDEANNWSYKWEVLEKNADGALIVYTVEEVNVPDYYYYDITGDNIAGYVLTNTITSVKVSKVDITTAEELEGATIQILDSEGNVVEEWVSGKEAHEITGLKVGEEYTLKETVAPDGYEITSDTTFVLDENGDIDTSKTTTTVKDGILLVEDEITSIKVSKVDIADGEELEGATIQILDKDGNVVEEWVSTTEPHEITGLKTGEEYTLRETVAPEGYLVTTDTVFVLDENGDVDTEKTTTSVSEDGILLVEDTAIAEDAAINVVKELKYGDELIYAVDQTFYVALYSDEACTQRVSEVKAIEFKNAATSNAVFDNLGVGTTYYVAECDENGNAVETGTLATGEIYMANFNEGKSAVVENGEETTIFFENEFFTLPNGFYKIAELTVVKKLVDADGKAKESDKVFYAGVFADKELTTLSEDVEYNILPLALEGETEAFAVTNVYLPFNGTSLTLYIAEVDEDGVPVDDGFAYKVSMSSNSVTFDEEHLEGKVTITNQEIEKEETEKKDAVKTGDESPLGALLAALVAALAATVALIVVLVRKRRRTTE